MFAGNQALSSLERHDQELADAIAEFCMSGNDNPLPRNNMHQNKAFKLTIRSMEIVGANSLVNPEAFGLLSDIVSYLHCPTKTESIAHCDNDARDKLIKDRERLECCYLQKLGQIVVSCRFDYEFVSVILAFLANLLRFDQAYHEVLRSVGLVNSLVALFLNQTNIVCSAAGSTQIRVEYPTSTVGPSQSCGRTSNSTVIDEKIIISMLASHCHQRAKRHHQLDNALCRADYIVLIDVMQLLVDVVQSETLTEGGLRNVHTLCGLPMLESVCTMIGHATFQREGLALWTSIIRLSLSQQQDATLLRNAVNTLLQALRYVSLAVYFPQNGDVTLAFPGNMVVLQGALSCIETLLRPRSVPTAGKESEPRSSQYKWLDETHMKEQFLKTLLDCDIILSLLGVLCAVTQKCEATAHDTSTRGDTTTSYIATALSLQSIFSLVTTCSEAEQQFCRCAL
ncbi:unnamed protein product [Phytophthora fragariaefolia]|uniref:Unnamed protein product n=1 Tax=Phytophthora fragariaefolia TaxID=1490495 RepID=A0A9W6XW01_9STRA|nr:unnamed protein product [Phytophthora fragariaefolia]